MDTALTSHTPLVAPQARRLGLHPDASDWDDAISDGMLALWQALTAYDPSRGALDQYLILRIRFRMIDGIRSRSGRGADRPTLIPFDDTHDRAEQPNLGEHVELGDLIRALAAVDPRLPAIALLLLAGYTRTETGALHGLSRTRIWQLLALAGQHRAASERTPPCTSDSLAAPASSAATRSKRSSSAATGSRCSTTAAASTRPSCAA